MFMNLSHPIKQGGGPMAGAINVRDLDNEDVEIVERLVERLREKARRKRPAADGFARSAGAWKGLVNGEELKHNIYESRLVCTRPEVKL
jgi:hypothetical protein